MWKANSLAVSACLMLAGVMCLNRAAAQDERKLPTINALAADKHEGEDRRVVFVVNLASPVKEGEQVNLHAMKEWDNPKSFWVALSAEAIAGLRQEGIKDPVAYFNGKLIRVDGRIAKVPLDNLKNMSIFVSNPAQIEVHTIGAAAADKHEGQICKVGFTVNVTATTDEGNQVHLHSMKPWDDPKSFWVIISPIAFKAFRKLGIKDPAAYYQGKRIRVEGKIVKSPDYNLMSIIVDEPTQIEILTREGK